jgi:DNA-directed RNA polymerase specialized sigma24 family protein
VAASIDDKKLIVLLSENNRKSYMDLYNRYRRNTYSVLLHYGKVPALAEDLLQDVFLKHCYCFYYMDAFKKVASLAKESVNYN